MHMFVCAVAMRVLPVIVECTGSSSMANSSLSLSHLVKKTSDNMKAFDEQRNASMRTRTTDEKQNQEIAERS